MVWRIFKSLLYAFSVGAVLVWIFSQLGELGVSLAPSNRGLAEVLVWPFNTLAYLGLAQPIYTVGMITLVPSILIFLATLTVRVSKTELKFNQYIADLVRSKKKFSRGEMRGMFFVSDVIKYVDKEQVNREFIEKFLAAGYDNWILNPFLADTDADVSYLDNHREYVTYLKKRLTHEQFLIYVLQQYSVEMTNGGREQWLFNSSGLLWRETLDALKELKLNASHAELAAWLDAAFEGLDRDKLNTREPLMSITIRDEAVLPEEGEIFRSGDVFKKIAVQKTTHKKTWSDAEWLSDKAMRSYIRAHIDKFTFHE